MRLFKYLLPFLFLTACSPPKTIPVTQVVVRYITATPGPTATLVPTASPTLTLTPTATPTPTAITAPVRGNPRSYQLLDPTPAYGAPCGLVDTFDFPLDPPHAEQANGGFGFGAYNNRYEKYHAGEDWGFPDIPNLGEPVYSIGHGSVTYAAPNGWGLDRGTIVIRHVFPWGGYVLSFYGHLDPDSVTLRAGDCVQRGDKIGEIGDPTSPPHLHFEIRLHLPNSTGHGYWSSDPAKAGWLPPSQTIWETRMAASPGVLWTRSYASGLTLALGTHQDHLYLVHGGSMQALDPASGKVQTSQPISDSVRNALLDREADQIYLLDLRGDLSAYPLSDPDDPAWVTRVNALSSAALLPLPGGGVLVADRNRLSAISAQGQIIYQEDDFATPLSWLQWKDHLVITTASHETPLWNADSHGLTSWQNGRSGLLALAGERIYLYAQDGLYRLDLEHQSLHLVQPLVGARLERSDLATTKDGKLWLVHDDGLDRRLLSFSPNGDLLWERSLRSIPSGNIALAAQNNRLYIFLTHTSSAGVQADLYTIDPDSHTLTRILVSGSRSSYPRGAWILPIDPGNLLLNIPNGPLVAFDALAAYQRITAP